MKHLATRCSAHTKTENNYYNKKKETTMNSKYACLDVEQSCATTLIEQALPEANLSALILPTTVKLSGLG